MTFSTFTKQLPFIKCWELPGKGSHLKLAPKQRVQHFENTTFKDTPKLAGVLALFYPNKYNETQFLLTERAFYKGVHAAQISLPGGKKDKTDPNLLHTALRETEEEVGIQSDSIQIIKELSPIYIPPSHFLVNPFIGCTMSHPQFTTNYEVASIIEVPLSALLHDCNLSSAKVTTSYMKDTEVPCFTLNNYVVWGATAMILSEIKDLIKVNFVL